MTTLIRDEFGGTNTNRPKLLRKRTFLLPQELNDDLEAFALANQTSVNEVLLTALENDFARRAFQEIPFGLSYYGVIRPMKTYMEARGYRRVSLFIGQLFEKAFAIKNHPINGEAIR